MTLLLASVVCGVTLASSIRAQAAFDAASLRVDNTVSDKQGSLVRTPGSLTATHYPLNRLLEMAYETQSIDLSRVPQPLRSEYFEIHARASAKLTGDEYWEMLRALVEERFKLKFHHETKAADVYALTIAKAGAGTGPKLTRSQDPDCPTDPSPTKFCGISAGNGIMRGQKVTMARLARELSRIADRPVQDKTDLTGIFDFELKWAPDRMPPVPAGAVQLKGKGLLSRLPLLPAAVEEELGLKMKPEKGEIEVLVVDHLEQPSEN